MNPEHLNETHPLFPSGDWEGFYTYTQGPDAARHPMQLTLNFAANAISGSGSDDVGPFVWEGQYDLRQLHCRMMKYYPSHSVKYEGWADENGIWGKWEIMGFRGGFHIWPKKQQAETTALELNVEENVKG